MGKLDCHQSHHQMDEMYCYSHSIVLVRLVDFFGYPSEGARKCWVLVDISHSVIEHGLSCRTRRLEAAGASGRSSRSYWTGTTLL